MADDHRWPMWRLFAEALFGWVGGVALWQGLAADGASFLAAAGALRGGAAPARLRRVAGGVPGAVAEPTVSRAAPQQRRPWWDTGADWRISLALGVLIAALAAWNLTDLAAGRVDWVELALTAVQSATAVAFLATALVQLRHRRGEK